MRQFKWNILLLFLLSISLFGCGNAKTDLTPCTVLFEDHSELFFQKQIYEVWPGQDLAVSIGVPHGKQIASVNYDTYTLSARSSSTQDYDYYTLTLHEVLYPALIRLTLSNTAVTTYHIGTDQSPITVEESGPHLRPNSLSLTEEAVAAASREGYLAIGWNTASDGSGTHIGFGSRFDHAETEGGDLYLEWLPCSEASVFTYEKTDHAESTEIMITGYHGTGDLVIPAAIEGLPVTAIATNSFTDLDLDILVLPPTIRTVSDQAFGHLKVNDFYFFDGIEQMDDTAFASYEIETLHINAMRPPVYSGSYFDTLSDKVDYLDSLQGERILALFCGSSARFGYDSPQIESAFPKYRVVNMGVYAYSNMLPQAMLLLSYLQEGDLLLSSPEFDAIEEQFCCRTDFDAETFQMLESNYDMLTRLDGREFTNLFTAFGEYNNRRISMEPRSYEESPSYYDEDGNPASNFTYNRYGDYILYRANNLERKNFGIKRAYYHPDHFPTQVLDGLNRVYDAFADKGVRVLFTYSPRSNISLSQDSTDASMAQLEELLRSSLHAEFLSTLPESLMDPLYFYGTDNHLSTEGVELHTKEVIEQLRTILEKE